MMVTIKMTAGQNNLVIQLQSLLWVKCTWMPIMLIWTLCSISSTIHVQCSEMIMAIYMVVLTSNESRVQIRRSGLFFDANGQCFQNWENIADGSICIWQRSEGQLGRRSRTRRSSRSRATDPSDIYLWGVFCIVSSILDRGLPHMWGPSSGEICGINSVGPHVRWLYFRGKLFPPKVISLSLDSNRYTVMVTF